MRTGAGLEGPDLAGDGPSCSAWAREQGLDPIGTAGCYRGYLLFEWPLPWPRDLSEDALLAPIAAAARSAGLRLQGLVPKANGQRRVICYRWPGRTAARFERAELVADPDEVQSAAVAVVGEPAAKDEIVDVLVCTHGRRDRCCGSFGTALFQGLSTDQHLPAGVRLWRTSHTGGHRFAPTAVILPEGTSWAFCDAALLESVLRREGPLSGLLTRYRGCAGMGSAAIQTLERAVLGEVGWPLFEMPRQGADLEDGRTELVVESPTGTREVWEATVRVGAAIPVPPCGQPIGLDTKSEPQLVVEGLRRRQL
jgi:hypothetical protein